MGGCDHYRGESVVQAHYDDDYVPTGYEWLRADPLVHIASELVDGVVDNARDFLLGTYRLRERCAEMNAWHAVRYER